MLDINKDKEFNLIKIFGSKKVDNWKKKFSILNDKSILAWIRDKIDKYTDEGKKAENFTISAYLNGLSQYCKHNKVENPSELLKEELDNRNLRVKNYLQFLLTYKKEKSDYLEALGFRSGKRPSNVTIRNNIQAKIKSFYSNRGVPITYNLKSVKQGANINEITLTKDIIKKLQSKLESANYRLICKFESQTGLRINDVVVEMTNGKYVIEKYQEHYFIRNFKTQKENVVINFLFFTKELAEMVQSVNAIDDLTKLDLTKLFLTRKNTRINKADYLRRLKEIIKALGIEGNIKTHGLRKYYNSKLAKNRKLLDDDRILTHWEGREAPYTDQIYSRHIKDIDFYYTEWKKMEEFICIDCIVYDKTNVEVLEHKEKIVKLNNQIDILLKNKIETTEKLERLMGLEKKILDMDKNFDKFIKILGTKQKEIDGYKESMLVITELLIENKDNLTDKQIKKLQEQNKKIQKLAK
ncbi:hypothetical protein LCGC14_1549610 [marine sediment metagenome]|uniref:Tyr recombinase domain-containing protein n=1 Tax=marine sediment metagenome TaxID=412755 RepID=A0A0F9IQQ2_9ZZZZ